MSENQRGGGIKVTVHINEKNIVLGRSIAAQCLLK
jgi:hypothetical protein